MLLSPVVAAVLAFGVLPACGGAETGDGGDVPAFEGGPPTVGPTLPGAQQGTGGTSSTTGGTPTAQNPNEGVNPNTPITQTPNNSGASVCTANAVTCSGNVLNRCDAAGASLTTQDCSTGGGSCQVVAGAAQCVAPACTPGAVTCDTANTVSTCAADGSAPTITRCPDGTNCTGNGQCTPVACNPAALRSSNNGGVTVYWFAQGTYSNPRQPNQDINCSFGSDGSLQGQGEQDRVFNIQDEQLFGAMNLAEYDGGAACGACVELSQGGRNVTITVADSCNPAINNNGTCTNGHIDLSRTAFQQLTGQNTGDINGIQWRMVPCDGVSNVQIQLKEATNQYWNQFIVLNHRYPIAKAEVEMEPGRWVEARRETYNFWLPPEGDGGMGGDMGTYKVRITDVNGAIIEEQLELKAGPQGGNGQFDCQ